MTYFRSTHGKRGCNHFPSLLFLKVYPFISSSLFIFFAPLPQVLTDKIFHFSWTTKNTKLHTIFCIKFELISSETFQY